jgi:hypothetical protein
VIAKIGRVIAEIGHRDQTRLIGPQAGRNEREEQ